MVNATIAKFGYPATRVAETEHWLILLRPQAVTLGSLVLAAKSDATSYGALPLAAFADQAVAVARVEAALRAFVSPDKVNYLMLMMVDPHVHFHVIPRYSGSRMFDEAEFADQGWPGMPDMANARPLNGVTTKRIIEALGTCGLA